MAPLTYQFSSSFSMESIATIFHSDKQIKVSSWHTYPLDPVARCLQNEDNESILRL